MPTLTALLLALLVQDPAVAGDLDAALAQARDAVPAGILDLADAYPAPEDAELETLRGRLAASHGAEALFLARVLAAADDASGAGALQDLLADADLGAAALATFGLPAFELDETAQQVLAEWLGDTVAEDEPQLWAEAALTLYDMGDSARRRAAKRWLLGGLRSPETAVRSAAALALGRSGDLERTKVQDELQRLSAGVGPDAVLARALLDRWENEVRLRERAQHFERQAQEGGQETAENQTRTIRILADVMRMIRQGHMEGDRYTPEVLAAAGADGMLQRLDPHSNFLTGEEYSEFMFDLQPQYGGIGAFVNTVNGIFTIIRPIYSGPAYRVGLRSSDAVLEVDGWSTMNQPQDEIIKRLKGEPGTEVLLKIARRGWDEPRDIAIGRELVEVPVLQTERLPGDVLYLDLVHFSRDCGEEIRQAIHDADAEKPLSGVVLDLRNNPGGLLDEAVDLCDVFLPARELIVTTKSRVGGRREYRTTKPRAIPESLPLSILINKYSASGSEIVAGALAIAGRATLVGSRTYGKGSVQNLFPIQSAPDERFEDENRNYRWDTWEKYVDENGNRKFDYGPRVKLTIAYYYLADGSTIHNQRDHEGRIVQAGGVPPDYEVAFPDLDPRNVLELERLLALESFRNYAESLYRDEPAKAIALAEFDGRDPKLYPGWDAFREGLNTWLPEDEVRRWVRRRLRGVVSDGRGKVFAGSGLYGDFVEDPQLRAAIGLVFEKQGRALDSIPEYAVIAQADAAAAGAKKG
ncbi:MAG TPA: S41 family peptidase [Planctomycetota bacterium]